MYATPWLQLHAVTPECWHTCMPCPLLKSVPLLLGCHLGLNVLVLQVVAFCHDIGVMHRDLKLDNFLLADESQAADAIRVGEVLTAVGLVHTTIRRGASRAKLFFCVYISFIHICIFIYHITAASSLSRAAGGTDRQTACTQAWHHQDCMALVLGAT